jgi:hypothetical protein
MSTLQASISSKTGIRIAAALLLVAPVLISAADAKGPGGGGGGGGARGGGGGISAGRGGGGGGVSFARGGGGGGISARSFSGVRGGGSNFAVRSFSGGNHFVARSFTPTVHSSVPRLANTAPTGNRFATASAHTLSAAGTHLNTLHAGNLNTGNLRAASLARTHAVFGNRAIANRALANVAMRSAIHPARFHGRFFGSHWPWWRGGIVVGWIGPVFWPYAYDDFFDYVFWPYAYDDFWPYAYDDVYYGIYGNYAYADPGVRSGPRSPARSQARGEGGTQRVAGVCGDKAAELTDWPIERITEIVQPTDAQRGGLDDLKAASAKAVDILKSGCPNDLPSTPTGRLAAMESRLQVMLQAVQTVRPALDRFYQSLDDEQKARFNVISPGDHSAATGKDQRDLATLCDEKSSGVTDLPIDRIAKAVQPTPTQQGSLDDLRDASVRASEGLKANCPAYQALTPTGRVEAMEKRLDAMLGAVRTVQPALVKFYDALGDEQKARFNSLRMASRPQG